MQNEAGAFIVGADSNLTLYIRHKCPVVVVGASNVYIVKVGVRFPHRVLSLILWTGNSEAECWAFNSNVEISKFSRSSNFLIYHVTAIHFV
jgi:hypothetical protein